MTDPATTLDSLQAHADLPDGWEQIYPGEAKQVGQARAGIREYLSDCPMADDVVVLVSELATNVACRSRREPGCW
jgi:hypothetical protein